MMRERLRRRSTGVRDGDDHELCFDSRREWTKIKSLSVTSLWSLKWSDDAGETAFSERAERPAKGNSFEEGDSLAITFSCVIVFHKRKDSCLHRNTSSRANTKILLVDSVESEETRDASKSLRKRRRSLSLSVEHSNRNLQDWLLYRATERESQIIRGWVAALNAKNHQRVPLEVVERTANLESRETYIEMWIIRWRNSHLNRKKCKSETESPGTVPRPISTTRTSFDVIPAAWIPLVRRPVIVYTHK